MSLLKKIQHNDFALWLTIISVIALSPNCFYVFYMISTAHADMNGLLEIPALRIGQAILVSLLIAGAILFYTTRKNYEMAKNFAYFESFVSLCYYWITLMVLPDGSIQWNWYIVPALAFVIVLPQSVKEYAKEIKIPVDDTKKSISNIVYSSKTLADFERRYAEQLRKQVDELTNNVVGDFESLKVIPDPIEDVFNNGIRTLNESK